MSHSDLTLIVRSALLGWVATGIVACSGNDSAVEDMADTIFLNGTILTMEGASPSYVEAVAVRDGVIVYAGERDGAIAMQGDDTVVRDLKGNTMLPGFIDPHGHFGFAINMVNQVNVSIPPVGPAKNIPAVIDALEDFRAEREVADGDWIVGWGYDADGLEEGRNITKLDLDPSFPNNKVILIHVSGHGAVLNSLALESEGIDADTKTPPGGIINRLPGSNEPAGLLMETAYAPVLENLPKPSADELLDTIVAAQRTYSSQGYTHAQDGAATMDTIETYRSAAAKKLWSIDLALLPIFSEMDEWIERDDYVFGEYDNGIKLQGVKFIVDGSPQGKTALVTTPYLTGGPGGQENWLGQPTQPKEDYIKQFITASNAGVQVFAHSNGDGAIDHTIEAVEAAGLTPADDHRTIVIHSQFQRPDQLEKYVELGMSPSYFTNHTFFWGDVHLANRGPEVANFISPVKSATHMGIVYSNHSDFNVTPLDPFFIMWTAMVRESRSGNIIGPDERIDAYTALQGLTTGPAWQLSEENRKGTIKEGLLADLVILSADPTQTSVDEIKNIEVVETIKEGKTIYSR